MPKKHDVNKRIEKLTVQTESVVASEMLEEFQLEILKRFKSRKNQIEDWQDLTSEEEDKLESRLRVIADKNVWNTNDLIDMALYSALLWNNK